MWVLKIESITASSPVSKSVWCILEAKILCLQCSLHVCARHSSSTSVGWSATMPAALRNCRISGFR